MRNKTLSALCSVAVIFAVGGHPLFASDKAAPKKSAVSDKEVSRLQKELDSMSKIADSMNKERVALKDENQRLVAEKAKLYEEMGVAYTKAGIYDKAIDAYTASLKYEPNNADIHYYLGLLHQKYNKDVEKAVFHFKRYLYLKPDAPNRDEVRYLIEMVLNRR